MNLSDELAVKRTILALERTQLSWIRTTFAITSAGVAIDQAAIVLHQADYVHSLLVVSTSFYIGLMLTIFAALQLVSTTIQYVRQDRELKILTGLKPSWIPAALPLSLLVILINMGVTAFLAVRR